MVGAVMALMIIVRCGLNCRKLQGAGIGKELGVPWVIRRGTRISSSSRSICRGHDRSLSGFVFLPSGDSCVEIDWVYIEGNLVVRGCRWTRTSREFEVLGSHRVDRVVMISRMSSRVRSGHVYVPRRFARPALVAVVVVSVVGVVGVVVGVERGGRGGEERRGNENGTRSVYCLLSYGIGGGADGWTSNCNDAVTRACPLPRGRQ